MYSPTPRAEPKKRKVAPFTMSAAESKLIVSRPRSRRRSIGDDQEEQKTLAAVGEEEEVEEEQERPDYTAQTRHMGKCNTFSIVVYLYLFTGKKYGRKDRSRSPSPGGGAGRFGFGRRNTTGSTGERDAQGKRGKGSLVGQPKGKITRSSPSKNQSVDSIRIILDDVLMGGKLPILILFIVALCFR